MSGLRDRVAAVKAGEKHVAPPKPVAKPAKPAAKKQEKKPAAPPQPQQKKTPKPEGRFRMPDKTEFHGVYDAATQTWQMTLVVPGFDPIVQPHPSIHHGFRYMGKGFKKAHPEVIAACQPPEVVTKPAEKLAASNAPIDGAAPSA